MVEENKDSVIIGGLRNSKDIYDEYPRELYISYNISMLPDSLFHYYSNNEEKNNGRKINHSLDALRGNTVYLQSAELYNDPFDCSLRIDPDELGLHALKLLIHSLDFQLNPHIDTINERIDQLYDILQKKLIEPDVAYQRIQNDDIVKNQSLQSWIICLLDELYDENRAKIRTKRDSNQIIHDEILSLSTGVSEMVKKNSKIVCFSENKESILMWSHYANSHKGFCIEYQLPKIVNKNERWAEQLEPWETSCLMHLMQVAYFSERPDCTKHACELIENEITFDDSFPLYKYGYLAKSLDWQYEKEWRFIYPPIKKDRESEYPLTTRWVDTDNFKFFQIKNVYLGCNLTNSDEIIEAVGSRKIGIYQAKPNSKNYQLEFNLI